MKRYLVACGVGTMVFGAVLGSAAALEFDQGAAQFGSSNQLACDTDGVTILGYNLETDGVSTSSGVKVTDISEACDGQTLVATVADGSNTQLRKAFKVMGNSGTETLNWAPVPVSQLETVRLTIG